MSKKSKKNGGWEDPSSTEELCGDRMNFKRFTANTQSPSVFHKTEGSLPYYIRKSNGGKLFHHNSLSYVGNDRLISAVCHVGTANVQFLH